MKIEDFPILKKKINGKKIIYLNSAATTQKPIQVIDSLINFYKNLNFNLHRGSDLFSLNLEKMYEEARKEVADFINADKKEIIFTKSTTESLNLLMYSLSSTFKKGDEILLTEMEHHSNLIPWQYLQKYGVKLRFVKVDGQGKLNLDNLKLKLNKKTKLVSLTHASNLLGTINPVKKITEMAHSFNSLVAIDAAQSAPHFPIDVKEIDCDFLAFSGHKMLAPLGIGVAYGKKSLLKRMNPFLYGGDMISQVYLKKSSWADIPQKFEAGTQNIGGVIALSSAISYLKKIRMKKIKEYEQILISYALKKLLLIKGIKIYGPMDSERTGIISFNIEGIHPHDVSEFLARRGIIVRAGHMCSMPLIKKLKIPGVVRISFYIYNSKKDIDFLYETLEECRRFFI